MRYIIIHSFFLITALLLAGPPPLASQEAPRTFTFQLPAYDMTWRLQHDPTPRRVRIDMQVQISDARSAEETFDEVLLLSDRFFSYTALYLPADADYDAATFWTAYFYRLLLSDRLDVKPSLVVGADELRRTTILAEPRLSRLSGVRALLLKNKKATRALNPAFDPGVFWVITDPDFSIHKK